MKRILFIAPCWPCGQSFGGQLRALHIGRALKQIGEVALSVVSSDVADKDSVGLSAHEFQLGHPVRVDELPNRGLVQRWRWAFDPDFMNIHGCVANRLDRASFFESVGDFDLVWILNSRTANILGRWQWPGTVLDIDDIPSTFQRTVRENGAGFKEKLKAAAMGLLLKRRERRWKDRFTVLSVCSVSDRDYLGGGERIHVIPNGFEKPKQQPVPQPVDPPRIGFIGLYSYLPNLEGVRWFVRNCWPEVKRQVPDARFRLIGKDTDGPLKPNAQDLDGLGWIADPSSEIATWSAMIVPVRLGAGTRIKIAEAFSRKCPVVSTTLGAFGYEVEHRRELLLADEPGEFAAACISLIRGQDSAKAMAERAFSTFMQKWTWDAIAPRVWETAEDCLRRSSAKA